MRVGARTEPPGETSRLRFIPPHRILRRPHRSAEHSPAPPPSTIPVHDASLAVRRQRQRPCALGRPDVRYSLVFSVIPASTEELIHSCTPTRADSSDRRIESRRASSARIASSRVHHLQRLALHHPPNSNHSLGPTSYFGACTRFGE